MRSRNLNSLKAVSLRDFPSRKSCVFATHRLAILKHFVLTRRDATLSTPQLQISSFSENGIISSNNLFDSGVWWMCTWCLTPPSVHIFLYALIVPLRDLTPPLSRESILQEPEASLTYYRREIRHRAGGLSRCLSSPSLMTFHLRYRTLTVSCSSELQS